MKKFCFESFSLSLSESSNECITNNLHLQIIIISVSFTVKATMPLFTVVLSRVIMKEKQTFTVYMSLVPIIGGVLIATLTEISFDMIGLIFALLSTLGFSLQNIFSKKVLKDTKIHHLRLLHVLGRLSFFLFLPVWIFSDMFSVLQHPAIVNLDYRVISLLFMDGVLNWLQNILAFSVLSLVTPLTYAVASASKRIFVIGISLFVLGNPVTWMNILGMVMASCGVLCYNRVSLQLNFKSLFEILMKTFHSKQAKYFSKVEKTSLPSFTSNSKYSDYQPLVNGKQNNNNGYHQQNLLFNSSNTSTGSNFLVM